MTGSVEINLEVPISSVSVVGEAEGEMRSAGATTTNEDHAKHHGEELTNVCRALDAAACGLNKFCEEVFSSQREQIVRLSVEIAEKILLKEISSGNYEIEKIVGEALKIAPAQQDVVVRINPDDLQRYREISQDHGEELLTNVKLVPDPSIGAAECVVETDKGMIEYFIEEHLKQVSTALEATG